MRQDERPLITAIQEVALGKVSDASKDFIKTLARTTNFPEEEKLALYGDNPKANVHNQKMLTTLRGDEWQYEAKDVGHINQFRKIPVPKVCFFKADKCLYVSV